MARSPLVSLACLGVVLASGCGSKDGPDGCGLGVAGPVFTVEGEPLRVPVACANGEAVPAELSLRGLPGAARWDAAAGVIAWTPTLEDAGVYDVEATLPSGEVARGRIGVADAWSVGGNRRPDPVRYTEEYGLPVVHLDSSRPLSRTQAVPATLTYRGRTYAVEVNYRGNRTLEFPKKSLTISFPETNRFSDPALGVAGRKKMVLVTTFDDQTHVRNRLAMELWKRLASGRFAVKTASAVVYLNGAFQGLYMLSEKLGGQVLAAAGLNGDGNLYQADSHAANFGATLPDGTPKLTWHEGYEKIEGTPLQGQPGAFDDLDSFVQLVASADDPRFALQLPRVADVDEYRDWWVLVMLASSADSADKNGVLFHDPRGGPWRATVWDWGASFGQDWQTLRMWPGETYEYAGSNELFRRLLAPPFGAATRARLGAAVRQRVPLASVLELYARLTAETAAVARRDEARWGEAQRAFFGVEGRTGWGSHESEVAYVRSWIEARWQHLASY